MELPPSQPASLDVVDAHIARCADAREDSDRLRSEVVSLKALAHPRAHFAAALFELDRARKGDPEARATLLDVADSLLAYWKDDSGAALAASHPALTELWGHAVTLLSGFEQKRFARQLDACWEARGDANLLKFRVAELGNDGDRRSEFARCLYHLELARQFVDGSRAEFARRAALLQEAYLDKDAAEELVGGDTGLAHLWGELIPYLDEFFETLDEARARAAAAAPADADDVPPTSATLEPESPTAATLEPAVTAPPPAASPGDGHIPIPRATPFTREPQEKTSATLPPGSKFPLPRDTGQPMPAYAPPTPPPMPPAMEATTDIAVPRMSDPLKTQPIPANWREQLPESHTAPIDVPDDAGLVETQDLDDITATLPPDPSGPTARPPPPPTSETLDPDLVAEAPPPPPNDSFPKLQVPADTFISGPIEVEEDEAPEPGPVTQAFWRGTEVALALLPPPDAPRVNTRVFAADSSKERKKLTRYLDDVKGRFTEAEVPESKAMQCMLKLYLAAHLKEKTLFGQKNEKRIEGFRDALSMLGRDPNAAAHCAVWFELDGPKTLAKLHDSLEVLADYLQYCSQNALDPLAPTSPALFLG